MKYLMNILQEKSRYRGYVKCPVSGTWLFFPKILKMPSNPAPAVIKQMSRTAYTVPI